MIVNQQRIGTPRFVPKRDPALGQAGTTARALMELVGVA